MDNAFDISGDGFLLAYKKSIAKTFHELGLTFSLIKKTLCCHKVHMKSLLKFLFQEEMSIPYESMLENTVNFPVFKIFGDQNVTKRNTFIHLSIFYTHFLL